MSRPNFIELCARLTAEDEKAFEHLWRYLGLSVDWSMTYATIGRRAQRLSQLSFLRLVGKGLAYQLEAPTLWDVDFRTAVAQAELEDREQPGAYHRIRFARAGSSGNEAAGFIEIDTTRPELIPACVALVAHPDDPRYQPLFGTEVVTPLFGVRVPIRAHTLADPEKGTGVAMICTFGDITDVVWWRELSLPVRAVIQTNGTFKPVTWGESGWESVDAPRAQQAYDQLAGLSATKARVRTVELLRESGDLLGDPKPITHAVKFYEKGDRPLEIVTSRQWFIKTMDAREALLARGRELGWHPSYMQARLENWINGLAGDWCISRQRFSACRSSLAECGRTAQSIIRRGCCRQSSACRLTHRLTCPMVTRRSSAISQVDSRATPTSWTPGQRHPCRRRLPAAGSKIRISSRVSSRWM